MPNMETRQERQARMHDLFTDPTVHMSAKEIFQHTYHWLRWELALIDMQRAVAKMNKHAKWLDNTEDVFRLRKDLHDL